MLLLLNMLRRPAEGGMLMGMDGTLEYATSLTPVGQTFITPAGDGWAMSSAQIMNMAPATDRSDWVVIVLWARAVPKPVDWQ